ncbi:TolB family protein [Kribbella sp. NPDC055071]
MRVLTALLTAGTLLAVPASAGAGVDQGRIVFSRYDEATGEPRIVVADLSGRHERLVSLPMVADDPVWSPSGRSMLVFAFPPTGGARPATVAGDGSGFRLLTVPALPSDADIRCTAWSPDGRRLLCQVSRPAGGDPALNGIYTIRASDGGSVQRLTTNPYPPSGDFGGGDIPGGFSPDGSRFVFMRAKPGPDPTVPDQGQTGALYVGTSDGKHLHQLTEYGVPNSHDNGLAHWSPDGSKIVFAGADGTLSVIRAHGGRVTRIPTGAAFAFSPNWSPDGKHLVVGLITQQGGPEDLYTLTTDGRHLSRVTNTAAFEDFADWR